MDITSAVQTLTESANTLFILIGAIMVLAMHAGFAFLEVGTVRHKNQVNALVKIITDFGVSAIAYFFVGSVVVHGVGGWIALAAVLLLGARKGRYRNGKVVAFAPSSIPFLALGAWILTVGWFGFNVMSAQTLDGISGLVAVNSLMAMVGGLLVAMLAGRNDPGFIHNGPLAGLVAVCAGSDLMHPVGALIAGGIAGAIFVYLFEWAQNKIERLDDVLGVWPLHGMCGVWGGVAAGIFGQSSLGGLGGVSLMSQLIGSAAGVVIAFVGGLVMYGIVKAIAGLRLSEEEEFNGADLSIHRIGASSME